MFKSEVATLIVLLSEVAADVAAVAREHVTLDATRRRLLIPGDDAYPSAAQIASWRLPAAAVAVVLAPDGRIADALDHGRAMSGAWIEDAFVRALRLDERDS